MLGVLLADDHPIVIEGIRRVLNGVADLEVVGDVSDVDGLFVQAKELEPDVIVLDVAMPGPGMIPVLERLGQEVPGSRVLVFSTHPPELYAAPALRAGACCYLSKDAAPDGLVEAIRAVHRSEERAPPPAGETRPLSARELEVLLRTASGQGTQEIASALALSPKTVSTYRSRVQEKLGLSSVEDMIRYALVHGLIQ